MTFVTYFLNIEIFEFTAHFVPCKLSLDVYENLMYKPCDLYFVSMNIHFLFSYLITIVSEINPTYHLVVELLRQQLVVPFCWANKLWRTNKYFETYLPTYFTFVLLKSPSSKSRISFYLLLVDRDPTTTTHMLDSVNQLSLFWQLVKSG